MISLRSFCFYLKCILVQKKGLCVPVTKQQPDDITQPRVKFWEEDIIIR